MTWQLHPVSKWKYLHMLHMSPSFFSFPQSFSEVKLLFALRAQEKSFCIFFRAPGNKRVIRWQKRGKCKCQSTKETCFITSSSDPDGAGCIFSPFLTLSEVLIEGQTETNRTLRGFFFLLLLFFRKGRKSSTKGKKEKAAFEKLTNSTNRTFHRKAKKGAYTRLFAGTFTAWWRNCVYQILI